MFDQYKGVARILSAYWKIYGGAGALLTSPYLHLALVITIFCTGQWRISGWWEIPISVLPGLISFTLAGYALLLALGDNQFRDRVTDKDEQNSALLAISCTFVHFIIIQTLALILAIIARSHIYQSFGIDLRLSNYWVGEALRLIAYIFWFLAFLIFIYALTSVLSIAFALFRVTRWFNKDISQRTINKESNNGQI